MTSSNVYLFNDTPSDIVADPHNRTVAFGLEVISCLWTWQH